MKPRSLGPSIMLPASKRLRNKLLSPFQAFFAAETSGGVVLLLAALVALIWANSPWQEAYHQLWTSPLDLGPASSWPSVPNLHFWINDGLMTIFFFVVGLEIKREISEGELATLSKASLPVFAAAGGMLLPALLYALLNLRPAGALQGFGIPMATDIAFAVGALALLGERIPNAAKVFLTALAIVDDIGAALIIALFYSGPLALGSLGIALACFALMLLLGRLRIRALALYGILGLGLWSGFLGSGVHPTLAGIVAAFAIPSRLAGEEEGPFLAQLEQRIHPFVAYGIMPLFALANAGTSLRGLSLAHLSHPITLGISIGLLVGKQLGIFAASWLAVRLKLSTKSDEVSWSCLYGLSCLAGIGFTMSIFIAGLAFSEPQPREMAKIGIFLGSLASGCLGWLVLKRHSQPPGG